MDRMCFPPYKAYSRAELLFYVKHPSSICRVAEMSGMVSGFALGLTAGRANGHVVTIDVIPEARRRGVGRALMESLHRAFRELGVARVVLEVDAADEGAQRFYRGLGYVRGELLRGYYRQLGDAFRMFLEL
jgi:ribosomal protein S18 acetylase RimI-like enzyme